MPQQQVVDLLYGPERQVFWGKEEGGRIAALSAVSPEFRSAKPEVQRAFLASQQAKVQQRFGTKAGAAAAIPQPPEPILSKPLMPVMGQAVEALATPRRMELSPWAKAIGERSPIMAALFGYETDPERRSALENRFKFQTGFAKGLGGSAEQLTSPTNIALLIPSLLPGRVLARIASKAPRLAKWAPRLAAGAFSSMMLADLSEEAPEAVAAYQRGEYEKAGEHAARAVVDAGLGIPLGTKAVRKRRTEAAPAAEPPAPQPAAAPAAPVRPGPQIPLEPKRAISTVTGEPLPDTASRTSITDIWQGDNIVGRVYQPKGKSTWRIAKQIPPKEYPTVEEAAAEISRMKAERGVPPAAGAVPQKITPAPVPMPPKAAAAPIATTPIVTKTQELPPAAVPGAAPPVQPPVPPAAPGQPAPVPREAPYQAPSPVLPSPPTALPPGAVPGMAPVGPAPMPPPPMVGPGMPTPQVPSAGPIITLPPPRPTGGTAAGLQPFTPPEPLPPPRTPAAAIPGGVAGPEGGVPPSGIPPTPAAPSAKGKPPVWSKTSEGYAGSDSLRYDEYPTIVKEGKLWRLKVRRAEPGKTSMEWPTEDWGTYESLGKAKAGYARGRPKSTHPTSDIPQPPASREPVAVGAGQLTPGANYTVLADDLGLTRGDRLVYKGRSGSALSFETPEGTPVDILATEAEASKILRREGTRPFEPTPARVPTWKAEAARTETGRVTLGADIPSLGKILGSSLYTKPTAPTITKELMQNAFDAVRDVPGGKITVDIADHASAPYISVADTGRGMTRRELETVFTDLGASGKREMPGASGGFGLAKAAPLMMGTKVEVSTVVIESQGFGAGRRMRHSFEATPDQLLGEGVVIRSETVPPDTPTGTVVKTYIDPKRGNPEWWKARDFARSSGLSLRPPGEVRLHYGGQEQSLAVAEKPLQLLAERKSPGSADISIYVSPEETPGMLGEIPIQVNNNGIYQFTDAYWAGGPKLKGVPKSVAVDVRSNVPEGDPGYPFTANREALRDVIRDHIRETVKQEIIEPAKRAATEYISERYTGMPTIPGIAPEIPVWDAGMRLRPDEMSRLLNNPGLRVVAETLAGIARETAAVLRDSPILSGALSSAGRVTERIGLIFSKDLHGLHVLNPTVPDRATVLINPFEFHRDANPSRIASLQWNTTKHEILHDAIGGHYDSFTTAEGRLAEALGARHEIKALTALEEAYAGKGGTKLRPDLEEALRIYEESRGRSEVEPDIFGGEGVRTEVVQLGGRPQTAAAPGLPTGGKGLVREGVPAGGREKLGGAGARRSSPALEPLSRPPARKPISKINLAEALEPPRRSTPAEIEQRMGGRGVWFTSHGKEIEVPSPTEKGFSTHGTEAMRLLGEQPGLGPLAARASLAAMRDEGWIRVRGATVQSSPESMGTIGYQKAVLRASENAKAQLRNGIFVEVLGKDSRYLPLVDIGEFLKAPLQYIRRTPAGLPMSRMVPPLPPEALPPTLREPAYA